MGQNRFGRAVQYGLGDISGFGRDGVFTVNPKKATLSKGILGRGFGAAATFLSAGYAYSQGGAWAATQDIASSAAFS
jgi:hypothetical protein